MECPSLENLIIYASAQADAEPPAAVSGSTASATDTATAVAMHMASGCSRCAADLDWYKDWYKRVMVITASDDSVEPPPWVVKRAIKLFETRLSETAGNRVLEGLTAVIATLIFDSSSGLATAGARTVESADRQLLYRAGAYHIDLQIAASPQDQFKSPRVVLTGQILRDGELAFESVAGLPLKLLQEGRLAGSTTTNRFGEFTLSMPERGPYDLQVEATEISITVVGLPIA